jgi:2-keto-4-pentenoate hydratase
VELIDDRNCDYASLDVLSLVADNSWNGGVVLGERAAASGVDLVDCEGIVTLDGAELDRCHGRDALGGPLIPLEWLANHLRNSGEALRAGDIVMTGSLIPTQFPTGPCRYGFTVAGIGSVEVAIVE